jgi:tetratricopeptide (TPR) repeat protein
VSLRALRFPASFEGSADREQLRRRALAFGGLWFLFAGMLAALGISIVLIASVALLLVGGAVLLLRRGGAGERLAVTFRSIERASGTLKARIDERDVKQGLQRRATVASHQARALLEVRPKEPAGVDRHREARQLNQLGAQLRRDGDYEEAAEQHRAALAILRELGERRAEALTLNNLALALVHTEGGVAPAIAHFEEALGLLRELGDEEHEGQVIANLASVRRRQGRDEDAESLLNAALDKLPPESSAYREVEQQLRRAS